MRNLAYQCKKQTCPIPFFFKQWGEWLPGEFDQPPYIEWQGKGPFIDSNLLPTDFDENPKWCYRLSTYDLHPDIETTPLHAIFYKAGVKQAGRRLDGCVFNQFPESKVNCDD